MQHKVKLQTGRKADRRHVAAASLLDVPETEWSAVWQCTLKSPLTHAALCSWPAGVCTWKAAVRYTRGLFVAGVGKLPVSWLKSCSGIGRFQANTYAAILLTGELWG